MTSVLSIFHRASGAFLSYGLFMLTWWLAAAASGPEAYRFFTDFCAAPLGLLLLLGWTGAFYYHLGNGIRHLFWDSGLLLNIKNAYRAGFAVLLFAALATAGTWLCMVLYN